MNSIPFISGSFRVARATIALAVWAILATFVASEKGVAEALTYNFVKFPPFQYQPDRPGSDAEGMTIDLLRAAAADIGLPLLYQQLPPQRLTNAALTGQMQLSLVSRTFIAPSHSLYLCSNTPITQIRPTLYVNQALYPNIQGAEDLTDELVYAPYSTSRSLFTYLPTSIKQDTSNKDTVVSNLFSKGRAGLVVNFKENMQIHLERSPPNFPYHAYELQALDIVLCISKKVANYEAIHGALELAILRIANSQKGEDIFNRHQFHLDFIAAPTSTATQ